MDAPFALDLTENPHPRMLAGAAKARAEAREGNQLYVWFWEGYLAAMCDATGERPEAIEAWVDRHQ